MPASDLHRCDDGDPRERTAALQDALYDLVLTRVTRPVATGGGLRRLRRDAHEAAALAQHLADTTLDLGVDDDGRA
jgi:hypothetical protein